MTCRCSKIRKKVAPFRAKAELPDDLRRALEACPLCHAHWRRSRRVAELVSLKRYEKPDPNGLARCRLAVRRQIEQAADEEAQAVGWGVFPVFRFSLAALLLVALLGLHMISSSHLPRIHTSEQALSQHLSAGEKETDRWVSGELDPSGFSGPIRPDSDPHAEPNGTFELIRHPRP